jgi:two-component system, LytTR family, response regulator
MQFTYYIIDDEPLNIQVLQSMLEQDYFLLECAGHSTIAKDGLKEVVRLVPDILFCDIEMPHYTGLQIAETIKQLPTKIIFITAFPDFAIEAIQKQASGYITKPIQEDKLKLAIENVIFQIQKDKSTNLSLESNTPAKIALATKKQILFVDHREILFLESQGNYTSFHFSNGKKELISRTLGDFNKLLPEKQFVRVHDKYLINLSFIKEFDRQENVLSLSSGDSIPVSIRKKEELIQIFEFWLKK